MTYDELKEANKKYWYLREGDMKPELLEMYNNRRGCRDKEHFAYLMENGFLFSSRDEALKASDFIADYIALIKHRRSR